MGSAASAAEVRVIYVGTSGWQYDSWRARFYPADLPKDRWLAYFSDRFPTVEVNNSFYRLPSAEAFARWAQWSADGFTVAVKASRFLTHIKRLREAAAPLELFWSRAVHLGPKLGPVLFQLPPRFRVDVPRLETFLGLLPRGIRAAFEFRDRSWETDDVFDLLDRAGAAFVLADRPGARVPDVTTGGWAYIRFHQGNPAYPDYAPEKLRRWADRIAALRASDTFIYFNNDPGAAAVRDGGHLMRLLARRRADVVPSASERRLGGSPGEGVLEYDREPAARGAHGI